jgi:hypothetical protein
MSELPDAQEFSSVLERVIKPRRGKTRQNMCSRYVEPNASAECPRALTSASVLEGFSGPKDNTLRL